MVQMIYLSMDYLQMILSDMWKYVLLYLLGSCCHLWSRWNYARLCALTGVCRLLVRI